MRKRLATVIALCGVAAGAAAFASAESAGVGRAGYSPLRVRRRGRPVVRVQHRQRVARQAVRAPGGLPRSAGSARVLRPGCCTSATEGFRAGIGHLLEFSLYRQKVVYDRGYRFGIDSFDISHDGRLIFMPTGENTSGNTWHVLPRPRAASWGPSPQAGLRMTQSLVRADSTCFSAARLTATSMRRTPPPVEGHRQDGAADAWWGRRRAGRSRSMLRTRLAFTTANRFLGFQISDVATGRVLYTVPVPGFSVPPTFRGLPSHGIGLSPDQRYLWLVDKPNRAVHEFDISGLPHRAPVMIATVHVSGPNLGWLDLSRDGRYLFAGDAGNVIDTQTRRTIARLGALADSRYNIEIDWAGSRVCAAYPRESLGYSHVASQCACPAG